MSVTLGDVLALVGLSLKKPRMAAAIVLRQPLSDQARWWALILLAVTSALVMYGVSTLAPATGTEGEVLAQPGPFFWTMIVGFGMVTTALLSFWVGRWRGGAGSLSDAVVLVAWLQVIQLALVAVQIVLMFLLPALAALLEVGSVLIFLWLLTNFVAEMHGFRSLGKVLAGVLLTFVAMVIVMTVLLLPFIPAGL